MFAPPSVQVPVLALVSVMTFAPPSVMAPVMELPVLVPSNCKVLLVTVAVTLAKVMLAVVGLMMVVPPLPPLNVNGAVICGLPLATFGPFVMFN